MKLEDQCVSLELAKRLKELGVKQESVFYWVQNRYLENPEEWYLCEAIFKGTPSPSSFNGYISAFTVAELGEMLPTRLKLSEVWGYFPLEMQKLERGWLVQYRKIVKNHLEGIYSTGETEADARVKLFIYLLENNLLERISK